MPWAVVGAVAGAGISASAQNSAAKKGAAAGNAATQATIDEQRRQFDLTRKDQQPFLEAGYDSLRRQNAFLNGDWSGFQSSPDYLFALDQGTKALDRGAAARGAMFSGGADADRIALGQGLATQNASNYWNKLAGRAGQGQTAATNLGQLGANMAGNIGNALMANGANQRNSIYDSANAWSNFGQQAVGAFGQWYGGQNKSLNGGWYLGNQPGKG